MLYCLKLTFQKVKVFTVVYFESSFRGRMDLISLMVGGPLDKQETKFFDFFLCMKFFDFL